MQRQTPARGSRGNSRWVVSVGPRATTVMPAGPEVRGCLLFNDKLIHTDSTADSWFLRVRTAAAAPGMSAAVTVWAWLRRLCLSSLLQAEAACSQVAQWKLSALPHLLHGARVWIRRTQLRLKGTLNRAHVEEGCRWRLCVINCSSRPRREKCEP